MRVDEQFRAQSVPRDAADVRRLSAGLESIGGFLVYGLLWLFITTVLALAVSSGLASLAGRHAVGWVNTAIGALGWLTFGLLWCLYPHWAMRRRRAARRLFREGTFVDAVVERSASAIFPRSGSRITDAWLRLTVDGTPRSIYVGATGTPRGLEVGTNVSVLFIPGYRYCAVLLPGGDMLAAKW